MNRIISFLKLTKFKYLINYSIVKTEKQSHFEVEENVRIKNCKIYLKSGSILKIGSGSVLENLTIYIEGNVKIGKNNVINNGYLPHKVTINIYKGTLNIGNNNRIRSKILIRFDGDLVIGDFNNINEESEIRTDEKIQIGNFNQISYKCIIWDTNTHNIYIDDKRRKLTSDYFPNFGYEYERPKTLPINIGDDCWIGQEAAILKGSNIKNSCIIGFRSTLSNICIDDNMTVVPNINNKIFQRKTNK